VGWRLRAHKRQPRNTKTLVRISTARYRALASGAQGRFATTPNSGPRVSFAAAQRATLRLASLTRSVIAICFLNATLDPVAPGAELCLELLVTLYCLTAERGSTISVPLGGMWPAGKRWPRCAGRDLAGPAQKETVSYPF